MIVGNHCRQIEYVLSLSPRLGRYVSTNESGGRRAVADGGRCTASLIVSYYCDIHLTAGMSLPRRKDLMIDDMI